MRVLITGIDSGLGLQLWQRFKLEGDKCIGTTHNMDKQGINKTEPVLYYEARQPTSSAILVDANLTKAGVQGIDAMVFNIGINEIRPFEDLNENFIANVMRVNCFAPITLFGKLKHRLRLDSERPPVVCFIVSDASWRPMRHSLAYNMSKAALSMGVKQMAREMGKQFCIFGINPGFMLGTEMTEFIQQQVMQVRGWSKEQQANYYEQNSVAGRPAQASQIAETIVALVHRASNGLPLSGAMIDLVG